MFMCVCGVYTVDWVEWKKQKKHIAFSVLNELYNVNFIYQVKFMNLLLYLAIDFFIILCVAKTELYIISLCVGIWFFFHQN